ncbi:PREDICTED: TBC1 domain family member 5 homolog A-like [Ceratosolen solmsi marchali]|uniref:TBC1 domain family member 5 homolog A-like n=1 Tax=Ceratosolen solmsi marchali TaxID=326594 RepID=A0AAJ6YPB7_9HYME|nr:PREDICTED: TBC1 domain family member 5 homolog A-like [Ceratosolen solmsi marchali]
MDDDEDWNVPTKISSKLLQQSNNSTTHQTLKITDGYKYSYEALSSPANIDDWTEPPSYGGTRRSSGYPQNLLKDNNRSYRNEKINVNKRFDSVKSNDNFSNKSSHRNFSMLKSNHYSNRMQNVDSMNDWDTSDNTVNQINGSWKGNVNISVNIASEDWDTTAESMPQNHKSVPNADSNASISNTNKDKLWDQMNETSSKKKSSSELEIYNSDSLVHSSELRNSNNMNETWDADLSNQSTSNTSRNGFTKDIPLYNPNNMNGQSYSNNLFNQRYENNYHSNKQAHSRNFETSDRFNRDSYSRHSRGNSNFFRHSPYERGSRGRGGRGGRGGRNSRDGSYQSFHSRDNSRNSGDRRDGSFQHNSYTKNRNNDRTSYQPPSSSFKNTTVESEEDWDSPSGFVEKRTENNDLPPTVLSSVETVEESWD